MIKVITIEEILNYLDSKKVSYHFKGNKDDYVDGYSSLFKYRDESMTFVSSLNKFSNYEKEFQDKEIKLIIIDSLESIYPCFKNTLQINEPKKIFFDILENVFSREQSNFSLSDCPSSHSKYIHSFLSPSVKVGKNVKIGYGCVIEDGVTIGDYTTIDHNVVIKKNVEIGNNCTIHSGVIIGESGFNPFKNKNNTRTMIKHYGNVRIKNDVHIGANTVISKGTIDDTVIEEGVKINKLVNIAHNVEIGKNTVITAPTFICGSVIIGENCHIAAHVIKNQRTVKNNAYIGLGAVVIDDVEENTTVVGNPAKKLAK